MSASKITLNILVGTMVAIWCGNFLVLKVCLREMPAIGLSAFRVIGAALILLPILLLSRSRHGFRGLGATDYLIFCKLAVLGLILNQTLFIAGLQHSTAAHTAIVVTFGPLFTVLFAWFRKQESLSPRRLLGMLVSMCGIVLLNFDDHFALQKGYLLGDLLTLTGSMAFAYYTVLSKSAVASYGPVRATALTYIAGAILFLPVGLPIIASANWSGMKWTTTVAFVYVAVVSSVLAPLIFYYALRRMSASSLASLTYLQPVVTTIASVMLLSERLEINFVTGAALVMIGVVLSRQRSERLQSAEVRG
ncbi:MAG: DMT family transporter [Acidobacteriota bacterium]